MLVFKVAVFNTVHDFFDYLGGEFTPKIGSRVLVEFRSKIRIGIVVGEDFPDKPNRKLKKIVNILDDKPIISEDILILAKWVSKYYQAPLPAVFSLVLPKKYRLGEKVSLPEVYFYNLSISCEQALKTVSNRAKKLRDLIQILADHNKPMIKQDLFTKGFNSKQLERLVAKNLIKESIEIFKPSINKKEIEPQNILNEEQANAVRIITNNLNKYHCFLLQGVTGSGKTEVYLQVIAKVLAEGRKVLILVPEIGLTPQLLARFNSRFSQEMLVIHSNLNDSERKNYWQLAFSNQVQIVIGTRSAVFIPMPNLGLIVIDEEHDLSLKQMDGVRYFAKDTALMRAFNANIPIILGSATPSLESIYNCRINKYTLLELTEKALKSQPLHYQILDIRNKILQDGLAKETITIISEHINAGNQVLVFINRRGFSPVLLCNDCDFVADCQNCETHLTFHRSENLLICHHCGFKREKLLNCQKCNSSDLLPIGIGTQRIYERLDLLFPTTAKLRIDRDETSKKNAIDNYLHMINTGQVQLIVGTQMLAKGHHFPNLSLVVVLDSDSGFYNQDFRALERLGQLLTQVAGRAGRAETPGQVLIQTSYPQDPLLNILIKEGYTSFASLLLEAREKANLPPFSYLSMLRAEDKKMSDLLNFMQALKGKLSNEGLSVFGPAPAPLAKKAGKYRMQLMLKSNSRKKLHASLFSIKEFLNENKFPTSINWNIDVDPQDLA
ncbi:MAG: primosomal protein N' [Legionellales bacterium RIFCSPHIGHO2_12_FULL_35_11]|nr:MAG: primosomal protein N' [Legionellales bacterium RIFCSPHIGHO2_12_FULL_35_11]